MKSKLYPEPYHLLATILPSGQVTKLPNTAPFQHLLTPSLHPPLPKSTSAKTAESGEIPSTSTADSHFTVGTSSPPLLQLFLSPPQTHHSQLSPDCCDRGHKLFSFYFLQVYQICPSFPFSRVQVCFVSNWTIH